MMNTNLKPISIQLYTLREEAAKDFPAVLRALASIGYKGVEPAGFFNFTPKEFLKYITDLGMVISSTHNPWAKPNTLEQSIDVYGELGVKFVTAGYGADDFKNLDAIKKTAEVTQQMDERLSRAGFTLVVHNHHWEFEKLDGRIKHEIFAELCPDVHFELDTYWAANYGENNAVEMVRNFADRSPLLHIKDGPLAKPVTYYDPVADQMKIKPGTNSALLPVGSGKIDVKGIIGAMNPKITEWLIVEQDTSDTDMLECVAKSYEFLVRNGLAAGNK